jgi:CO dehydrogenase nickel-insertion accessory protein CooC1
MSIELTEEQIMVTMRFIVNKMREEEIQINNPEQVLRYMILNPLPDHDTVASEDVKQQEREKAKRIALLTEELERLEGN